MSFNWEIYRDLNTDIVNAGLVTKEQIENHYYTYGCHENRQLLYPNFNVDNYRKNYNDLQDMSNEQLELHYLQYGYFEGRVYDKLLTNFNNCIVTAYYNISSKFPKEQYITWINNFMDIVQTDVIIYTSEDMVDFFKKYNKSHMQIRVIKFNDLYYYKYYDIFKHQSDLDSDKRRSPELYILWYNKLKFIEEASKEYGNKYNNYIWCDIGVFREKHLFNLRRNFGNRLNNNNTAIFLKLREATDVDIQLYPDGIYGNMDGLYGTVNSKNCFVGGGIIYCPLDKITDIIGLQDDIFNKLINSKRFYGCDQRCYSYMWGQNKYLMQLISAPENYSSDKWFYLLDVL